MSIIEPSLRLADVHDDIRGALARRARELQAAGRDILALNIGHPAHFGWHAPAHVAAAVTERVGDSDGDCGEQGLDAARAAIAAQQLARGVRGVNPARTFIGNGVSELIDISLRALLDTGDEVLLPCPDYPLWSTATHLNGGRPVYYPCPASSAHCPDPAEVEARVTPRTRALVLINPNNPTGAVYPRALLEQLVAIARRHDLLLLSDEIYDGIVYADAVFQPLAPLADDHPCLTFAGLSKVHRACGYRVGWMTLSGAHARTRAYRDALQRLAALRRCPNVPAQRAVAPALQTYHDAGLPTAPGGRLERARAAVIDAVAASEYLELVPPRGALYAFPSVRVEALPVFDDQEFALRLLEDESVLLTPGSSFNLTASRHLRLALLPAPDALGEAFVRIERTLTRLADSARVSNPMTTV